MSRRALSRRAAALTAATALGLAACGSGGGTESSGPVRSSAGSATQAAATRTVEHAMGSSEVPVDVERVVVLDTGELDAVVSLGLTPVGAVTTDVSPALVEYLEPELEGTEAVGTIGEPNLEAIAALQPDLILSNTVRHEDLYDELSEIAPTVFAADVGVSWKETLLLAGEALGEPERAQQLIADYEVRTAAAGEAVADGEPGSVEVSVVRFLPGQIRLYGEASFIGTVLDDAGFARPQNAKTRTSTSRRITGPSASSASRSWRPTNGWPLCRREATFVLPCRPWTAQTRHLDELGNLVPCLGRSVRHLTSSGP